ncbi:MAG: polyprenyl synthetase family protein [Candidatus Marinimicrobia bacterium]|nr:polyprenyl synthetase family protein [Candidatus Neomarinimicrobiota bacterium]
MSDTKPFSELIDFIRSETDRHLREMDLPCEPSYLYEPIHFALKGKGKRLRPILVHLSGRGFDAEPVDLMHAGMAVELMHNFTLVHDDIMDNDHTRHGQPTIHKQYGINEAILTGDSIFALAQLMIGQVNSIPAFQVFNKASLSVCEGQAFDLEYENDPQITLDQYLNMIGKKTGELLSLCAELGAILGHKNEIVRNEMRNYGMNLGKAFQIQDDILEIFSDVEQMGKSLGSDITAGKQTIMTILAKKHDGWDQIETSNEDISSKLNRMRTFFIETGIKNRAEEMTNDFIQKANSSLLILKDDHRDTLNQFTESILNRTY